MALSYPDGKLTCSCGNADVTKFRPQYAKPGKNPMQGINLRCTVCNALHDMSKKENQKP